MMSHIVESSPLTKLNGGLSRLHSADEDAVSWLTSYASSRIREEEEEDLNWLTFLEATNRIKWFNFPFRVYVDLEL